VTASLLTTKLQVPPVSPRLVPRPHLIQSLDEGLHLGHRLTLVSASAGFGKTTLLSDWLAHKEEPVAWFSLDEGDNDPGRFVAYLLAALQGIDPAIGQAAGAAQLPQAPSLEPLLTGLVNDIVAVPYQFILVLDDYHLVKAPAIHQALTFLLDHLPPFEKGMHLVIASRADPALPIARLRGRGQLTELHAADLRFTPQEAAAFLNEAMGLSLSAGQIAALDKRTEGWIVGLQLAALSMQGHHDVSGFIDLFAGSHRYVLDYLTEEVLGRQPPEIQAFLLQTAILDRLTGPLCEAVTGRADGQSLLESLEAANLFVLPLDQERRWYRYHPLFADLLRQRLQWETGNQVPELHRRAGRWYEANGLIPQAVGHALAAEDFEQAASLIEWGAWAILTRGEITTLIGWLDRLPVEIVHGRPQLGILYAWALALTGDLDGVEPSLARVDLQKLPGEAAAIRAFVATQRDEMSRAIELCQQVFEQLPEEKWFSRGIAAVILGLAPLGDGDPLSATRTLAEAVRLCRAAGRKYLTLIATAMLGDALQMGGQLGRAAGTYRQALQLAEEQDGRPAPFASMAHVGLARLLYEWNDLDGALHHATQGVALSNLGGLTDTLQESYLILARVYLAGGAEAKALDLIQEAEQLAQRYGHAHLLALAAALRAKLEIDLREVGLSPRGRQQPFVDQGAQAGYTHELDRLAWVRSLITRDWTSAAVQAQELRQAREVLARLLKAAEVAGRMSSVIEILVLQALAFHIQGDLDQALPALRRALALAEPEGYVRTFVDEGPAMAGLLRHGLAQGIAPGYIGKLLAARGDSPPLPAMGDGPPPPGAAVRPLVEPLSERELEVLGLVAAGLSNREIAGELVIAVSTVKSHINHIYGKLEVKSRTQSVARARMLGLL